MAVEVFHAKHCNKTKNPLKKYYMNIFTYSAF